MKGIVVAVIAILGVSALIAVVGQHGSATPAQADQPAYRTTIPADVLDQLKRQDGLEVDTAIAPGTAAEAEAAVEAAIGGPIPSKDKVEAVQKVMVTADSSEVLPGRTVWMIYAPHVKQRIFGPAGISKPKLYEDARAMVFLDAATMKWIIIELY